MLLAIKLTKYPFMVVACRVHLEPFKTDAQVRRVSITNKGCCLLKHEPFYDTFWSNKVQNMGSGMYKNRTFSTILI